LPFSPKLGISGNSCKFFPIPWPAKSLITEKPFFFTYFSIAYPILPVFEPAYTSFNAFSNAFLETSINFIYFTSIFPTGKVSAQSP
jgi:hypothetical protein